MVNKNYNELDVARILNKNKDISVDTHNKTINYPLGSTNIGNSSYGKIDYLIKVHGYVVSHTNKTKINTKKYNDDETEIVKHTKREKLNMVNMVKNTMKRNK